MFKIFFWANLVFAIMNVGLGFYWLAGFNGAVALLTAFVLQEENDS